MKVTFTSGVLAVSLLSLLAGCAADTSEKQRSSAEPIIGGTTDTGHPSVGLIRSFAVDGSGQLCTGTLIAPMVVLTAGHCSFINGNRAISADISFDAQPNIGVALGTSGFTAGTIIPHPLYDQNPADGHDISILLLQQAAPAPVSPIGAAPAVGSPITSVGYGKSQFGTGDQPGGGVGLKRQITIPVDAVAGHEFTAGSEGHSTCHGDSGGPEFQGGAVVGVTSYGDTADCHGIGHDMRVDDNLSFISPFLEGGATPAPPPAAPDTPAPAPDAPPAGGGGGGGTSCSISVQCVDGQCQCGDGPNAGTACDGRIGLANSCDLLCETCN